MTSKSCPVHTCKVIHPKRKLKCMRHEHDRCGAWHVFDYGSGFQFRWRFGKPVHIEGCKCTNAEGVRKVFATELRVAVG